MTHLILMHSMSISSLTSARGTAILSWFRQVFYRRRILLLGEVWDQCSPKRRRVTQIRSLSLSMIRWFRRLRHVKRWSCMKDKRMYRQLRRSKRSTLKFSRSLSMPYPRVSHHQKASSATETRPLSQPKHHHRRPLTRKQLNRLEVTCNLSH